MNVKPDLRFQGAEELRHAVEGMKACMTWNERVFPNGVRWTAAHGNRCFEVSRQKLGKSEWHVELKKGNSKNTLRRVGANSSVAQTETDARRATSRILQDYVLGRLN